MGNLELVYNGKVYKTSRLILYKKIDEYNNYYITNNENLNFSIYEEDSTNTHYPYAEARDLANEIYKKLIEYPIITIVDETKEGKKSITTISNITYIDNHESVMLYYSTDNGDCIEKTFLVLYTESNKVGYAITGCKID